MAMDTKVLDLIIGLIAPLEHCHCIGTLTLQRMCIQKMNHVRVLQERHCSELWRSTGRRGRRGRQMT